jgi:riboflavin kinase/FMN adenylyltransferase
MRCFQGYSQINESFARPIVTIGNFDGLHRGHRQIIDEVLARARKEGGTSVVYTFRPHPHLALAPTEELQLINTYDEKVGLLGKLGVDVVIEEPFSREFSTLTAEKFVNEVLLKRLSAHALYVGYDFGFGKDRSGTLEVLQKLCAKEGLELHVAKPLKTDGEICSSSRIRDHIKAGAVAEAAKLLGREFFYRGVVTKGDGRGHKLGFPTANVVPESKLWVKEGVYATWAVHGDRRYRSVTNVGRRPTFIPETGENRPPVVVETHILDFDQDIYGESLEVRMVARIRDEVRFSGIDALVSQIRLDIQRASELLDISGKEDFAGPR